MTRDERATHLPRETKSLTAVDLTPTRYSSRKARSRVACRDVGKVLSGKYHCLMTNTQASAKALGRLGGQARARRLSSADRRRIAALGGEARSRSLEVARRIADNFAYVSAMQVLGRRRPSATRVATWKGPLPGLYPGRK